MIDQLVGQPTYPLSRDTCRTAPVALCFVDDLTNAPPATTLKTKALYIALPVLCKGGCIALVGEVWGLGHIALHPDLLFLVFLEQGTKITQKGKDNHSFSLLNPGEKGKTPQK